jgi:hypothetical protein
MPYASNLDCRVKSGCGRRLAIESMLCMLRSILAILVAFLESTLTDCAVLKHNVGSFQIDR